MKDEYNPNYPSVPNSFSINNYLQSIKDAIYQVTKDNLFNNLSMTIQEYKEKSKESFNDSLQLLQAMKPFVHEKAADNIEQLSDVFSDIQALKMFVNHYMENEKIDESVSEKPDQKKIVDKQGDLIIEDNTVYEIDEKCKPQITAQGLSHNTGSIYAMLLYVLGSVRK